MFFLFFTLDTAFQKYYNFIVEFVCEKEPLNYE